MESALPVHLAPLVALVDQKVLQDSELLAELVELAAKVEQLAKMVAMAL